MNETHLVLHGLAIKKHATADAVAGVLGLDVSVVRATLGKLVEAKRVVEAQGKYLLAPAARMALDMEYTPLYEDVRANSAFASGYEEFERLNNTLKQLITEWQTVDVRGNRVPNDHGNKDYDDMLVKARSLSDQGERAKLYEKMQEIEHDEAPDMKIAHSIVFETMRADVTGFKQSPLGRHEFQGVDIKQ